MTLDEWMLQECLTTQYVAEKLGLTSGAVSNYRHGRRIPQPDVLKAIQKMTRGKVRPISFRREYKLRKVK